MNWKDLKVRTRIIVFFMVPLVLMGGIGVWTYLSTGNIVGRTEHLKNESLVFAGIARQMDKDIIQIQQWFTDISATRGMDGLNDGFKKAEESYISFLSGLERFDAMFKEENDSEGTEKIRELRALVDKYYDSGKSMAKGYIEGGPQAGNKMMRNFDDASIALSAALSPFIKGQINEITLMTDEVDSLINRLKNSVLIIFLVSVVLVLVSGAVLTRSISLPLNNARNIADSLAKGHLNVSIKSDSKDEIGQLIFSMGEMVESLKNTVGQIKGHAHTMASNSEEVSVTTAQLTSGINEQNQQIEQSVTATTEVSHSIVDVARNASSASDAAKESASIAGEGRKVVDMTVTSMLNIAGNIERSSQSIGTLGDSSKQIGDIINVINDIAGQTNLLALNAAIEAARAGEQGRGFAVVADEVRKLAEKTSKATDEITDMIKKIQVETEVSVKDMAKSTMEAEEGVKLASQAKDALDKIVTASEQCLDMVQSIAAATEEQSTAIEEVSSSMENIASVFGVSREGISQISTATNELAQVAGELMNLVSWFKTDSASSKNGNPADNAKGSGNMKPSASG
ncbi:MAG: HAMP domain-containing methyl-accepting chemotaxis protein [Nitrospirota bacterium]|nr:HAMP domain-containing methyl-accepting chemotaxis protein [Nitrospirota bacterium]